MPGQNEYKFDPQDPDQMKFKIIFILAMVAVLLIIKYAPAFFWEFN